MSVGPKAIFLGILLLETVVAPSAYAKIRVNGTAQNKQDWNDMIAKCREEQGPPDAQGNPTFPFRDKYDQIAASNKWIFVSLVRGHRIFIDEYKDQNGNETGLVDLDDLDDRPKDDPEMIVTRCQHILHFLCERFFFACNPQAQFMPGHNHGIDEENKWREAMGKGDKELTAREFEFNVKPNEENKKNRLCFTWKWTEEDEEGNPVEMEKKTYVYFNNARSDGNAVFLANFVLPDGVELRQFNIMNGLQIVQLPPPFEGESITIDQMTGSICIQTWPDPDNLNELNARVMALNATATSIALPDGTSTGTNFVTVDIMEEGYGRLNLTNGQVAITFCGDIVNDLYPPSDPLPYCTQLTAHWDLENEQILDQVSFHTAGVQLFDNWSAQDNSHPDAPAIISLDPVSGPTGTLLVIEGVGFSETTIENVISFNGTLAAEGTLLSEGELLVTVPPGATTGPISFELHGNISTGNPTFTVE